jgi:hypothetical protein
MWQLGKAVIGPVTVRVRRTVFLGLWGILTKQDLNKYEISETQKYNDPPDISLC